MKLGTKLALAINAGVCAVLAVNAWLSVQNGASEYEDDVRRDHRVLGRALAAGAELVWRQDGRERALELIEQVNQRHEHLTIRFVRFDAPQNSARAPLMPEVTLTAAAPYYAALHRQEGQPPSVVSYVAAPVAEVPGAIEMVEPLVHEAAHVREAVTRTLGVTAVLVTLCSMLTFVVSWVFVARPLRRLTAKARRIGAGDLSGPLQVRQQDEVRELADEMNAMCTRLEEAQARVAAESEARLRAVQQLRHDDRLRTVGEIASAMAHELGTPLNVVRMRGEMVASGEVLHDAAKKAGEIVVREADRMAVTLRQLLDFSRRDTPEIAREDLARVARQVVALLSPVAERHGVQLGVEAPAAVSLSIDAGQIRQALSNLVINAIQATPPGGSVRVRVDSIDGDARVEVEDSGHGVAPEHLGRVFDPFFTTKRPGEGTGLGLSVALGIAREHGGTIEVESEQDAGSRFTLRLPGEVST